MNTEPDIAIWALTPNGLTLAKKLSLHFKGASLMLSNKLDDEPGSLTFDKLADAVSEYFDRFKGHIFLMATGIVVRVIAKHIQHKTIDPAVVVVDDAGSFAISLISGHLGGANELAKSVAAITGGIPVITTATDVNHLPSIDLIAAKYDLVIEDPSTIKTVNMAFLKGQTVLLKDPYHFLDGEIPESFLEKNDSDNLCTSIIKVDDRISKMSDNTLYLRPKILSAGIGCNRGTSFSEIRDLLYEVCDTYCFSILSIKQIASIDIKNDEFGIIELSKMLEVPIRFYDSETLDRVDTIKNPSKYAKKYTGARSVCEAAAILSANHGELIVTKKKTRNVTIALAREKSCSTS